MLLSVSLALSSWVTPLIGLLSILAWLNSLHGIEMPKRDYISPRCVFPFFQRLISEVTEWISTKLGHIFTYDCYLKNLVQTPLGIYPHRLGAKKCFLGIHFELDQTYLCNGTWYQQSTENGWEQLVSFCPPPQFSHSETLPAVPYGHYITDSRQTVARVM